MDNTCDIDQLLAKHFAGEALMAGEKMHLDIWIAENSGEYERLLKITGRTMLPHDDIEFDTRAAWQRTENRLGSTGKTGFRHRVYRFSAVAAAVVIFGTVSLLFLYNRTITTGYLTSAGERETILLPDGSEVLLSQNSSLTYAAKKHKGRREVKLTGKAFFNIAKKQGRPFVIDLKGMTVEVLGTSFLVDAANPATPSVFVKTGTVKVSANDRSVVIGRNEKVKLTVEGSLQKDTITSRDPFPGSNSIKVLNFEHIHISELIKEIRRQYGIEIRLQGDMKEDYVTASFRDMSVEEILKELSYLCNCKYKKSSENIYILYKDNAGKINEM